MGNFGERNVLVNAGNSCRGELAGMWRTWVSQRVVCWRSMLWRVPITRTRPLETMVRSIRHSLTVGLFQRVEGSSA